MPRKKKKRMSCNFPSGWRVVRVRSLGARVEPTPAEDARERGAQAGGHRERPRSPRSARWTQAERPRRMRTGERGARANLGPARWEQDAPS